MSESSAGEAILRTTETHIHSLRRAEDGNERLSNYNDLELTLREPGYLRALERPLLMK